jgi:hypothetical protein
VSLGALQRPRASEIESKARVSKAYEMPKKVRLAGSSGGGNNYGGI